MGEFQTRAERGIHVHVLPTTKYKMTSIVTTLTAELREETATPLALIPYVLMRGSEQYRTPEKLQLALDNLYGASLFGSIDKKGERHIVDFTMFVPNEKFLATKESLFEKALAILCDILLQPLVVNGHFSPDHVTAEIAQHQKRIQAVIDDKISLARERCLSEMTQGEPYSIPRLGYEQQLDAIAPQELYSLYQQVLKTAPIHVYVIGDVELEPVCEQIFRLFQMERAPEENFPKVKTEHQTRDIKEVVDRMDVNQGKLNLGFWTNIDYSSDDFPALVVCNGIFGGFPHSKLFTNVREKNSLAYYVSSRLDGLKGLMYVQAGVEVANFDKARQIIGEQLEVLKQGQISADEMNFTVSGLVNSYKTSMDSATSQADMHMNGLVAGRIRSNEEMIAALQKVTVEDVVRVAQGIQLDTVYMLRNKEGNLDAKN